MTLDETNFIALKERGKSLLLIEIERVFFNFLDYDSRIEKLGLKKMDDFCLTEQLKLIRLSGTTILYIDFENLLYFSEELADLIEDQYMRVEYSLKKSIKEFVKSFFQKNTKINFWGKKIFRISFYNLPNWKHFKNLKNSNYGKLLCTIGNIVRVMDSEPRLISGVFECLNTKCKNKVRLYQTLNLYSEPRICPICKTSDSWDLITEESVFIEVQKIKIQEIHNRIFEKNIPMIFEAFLIDVATNLFNLGNKCTFTGYMIPMPLQKIDFINKYLKLDTINENFSFNLVSGALFYPCFVVNHVFYIKENFEINSPQLKYGHFLKNKFHFIKNLEKKIILKLRKWPFFLKKIESFFVNDMKKYEILNIGLLLMLVGGVEKKISKNHIFRGNINLSIIYPPDFAIRNLFRDIKIFNPEISYANGLTSGFSGLTGTVVRDLETNFFCIDSGLFTNKNKNFYFIENFHILDFKAQKIITDFMEKQEFTINKAEIKLTLKSKVSVFAITELSSEDIYNQDFLSRIFCFQKNLLKKFDLNFFLFSENNYEFDLLNSKKKIEENKLQQLKKKKFNLLSIQMYLSFAKKLSPFISSKSYIFILKIYLFLKKIIKFKKDILDEFCSRDLETLIRLSEAFSKLTLSSEVQIFHIKASARMIFNSVYLNGIYKSDKRINTVFLEKMNKVYSLKKYGRFLKTKFHEYSLISKKLFLIIKNKKSQKLPGIFFLNLSKTFFFYFSESKGKNIGLKRIKIFVNTLKHIIFKTKRFFITKLSRNSTSCNDRLILNIT